MHECLWYNTAHAVFKSPVAPNCISDGQKFNSQSKINYIQVFNIFHITTHRVKIKIFEIIIEKKNIKE